MSPGPGRASALRDPLGLAVACALGAALTYVLAVQTGRGQILDDRLRGGIGPEDARFRAATEDLLSTISVSSLALMGVAIMGIALIRGRPRRAVAAGVLILGANITTQVLKRSLPREELHTVWWADPNSYPSGHTTVAMALAMGLLLVVPSTMRTAAAIAGGAYAVGVGVAVIGLGWHRPSDVIGAYLVIAAWTCLTVAALGAWPDRPARRAGRPVARWWGLALAACCAAFVSLVALRILNRLDVLEVVADRTGFVAAALVCGAVGAALIAAVAALIARSDRSLGAPRSG